MVTQGDGEFMVKDFAVYGGVCFSNGIPQDLKHDVLENTTYSYQLIELRNNC